jgi:hypothetical protein
LLALSLPLTAFVWYLVGMAEPARILLLQSLRICWPDPRFEDCPTEHADVVAKSASELTGRGEKKQREKDLPVRVKWWEEFA